MAGAQVRSLGLAKRLLLVSVVMAAPLGPILIGMLNDQVGGAQSVAAISSPPAFEVAAIHRNPSGGLKGNGQKISPDRLKQARAPAPRLE